MTSLFPDRDSAPYAGILGVTNPLDPPGCVPKVAHESYRRIARQIMRECPSWSAATVREAAVKRLEKEFNTGR